MPTQTYEASDRNLDFREKIADTDAVNETAGFLSVSFDQAVLFACIFVMSLENPASKETFSRHFKCSIIKLISISHEFETLENFESILKKVFAGWVTGTITVPHGNLLQYIHAGYASVYEKDYFSDKMYS